MSKYDLIIVGAGLAGCAAAYTAAKVGLKTLVIERGKAPGAKTVTGGRIYGHSLEELIPGFADEAPVQRCVTRERISLLTDDEAVTMEFAGKLNPDPAKRSYTVLRAPFDAWLWSKAEKKGAQLLAATRVDKLIQENGAFQGVITDKGEYRAPVTILSDGVNSILAQRAGLAQKPAPGQLAVGVKEVIKFSPEQMADKFECVGDQGMAWLFAGSPTDGHLGGGFLYTNKDSVSVGIVFSLGSNKDNPPLPKMLAKFKEHPAIAPLLSGGEAIRYPGHMVAEGGLSMMPKLVHNGLMIAGDAAAMCVNLGYTIRGMDFAIAAGRYAAEAAAAAHKANNYSAAELEKYVNLLEKNFVLQEMKLYSNAPHALNNERVFNVYPAFATALMKDIFTVDGTPAGLVGKFWSRVWKSGIALSMFKDGFQILRSL